MSEGLGRSTATEIANESWSWYKNAARRSRAYHRSSELAVLCMSASVPIVALSSSANTGLAAAILGAGIVVVTGVRNLFHWQDNYVRFSRSREAVDVERRRYAGGLAPYNDARSRDALLIERVIEIEQDELHQWSKIARPPTGSGQPLTS